MTSPIGNSIRRCLITCLYFNCLNTPAPHLSVLNQTTSQTTASPCHSITMAAAQPHSHDGGPSHTHSHEFNAAEHGHSHEILDGPGSYANREMPLIHGRDWDERAFTIGIGGYAFGPLRIPSITSTAPPSLFPSLNITTPSQTHPH